MAQTHLGGIPLFDACESSTRAALEAGVEVRRLAPGQMLFVEGEPSEFMFVVREGELSVRKRTEHGTEVVLRTMGPGEVGGLTSMFTEKTRSASLAAVAEAVIVTVPKEHFTKVSSEHPDLLQALVTFLAAKVRGKTQRLASLLATNEDQRTAVAVFDAKRYDMDSFGRLESASLVFRFFEAKLEPQTAALAAGHDAVCAFVNDDVGQPTLEALAQAGVGLVAMRCAGFNNVDIEAAGRLGIDVVRVPAYSPHAVAEHAVALILTLNRKTHRAFNRVREGNFSLAGLVGFDLHGRTAGVVGLGKIGRCLAEILVGFGMEVLAYDVYPDAEFAEKTGVVFVELDELLRRSDVVSLHTPLMPATHHLIDADRIAKMKPGAMLINTSRGGLVDAQALIGGLKSGRVGAAGLDVYEEESEYFFEDRSDRVITDDLLARLMSFNNVVITSHQAFLTSDALDNIATTTRDNIQEWISGRRGSELTNRVD